MTPTPILIPTTTTADEGPLPGLADGRTAFFSGFVKGARPAVQLTVSQWAELHREVSAESGSPKPGKWRNARAPHLVEPMDRLSWSDPCKHIVIKGPAQSAKSEGGVNFVGYTVDCEPCTILIVLPSMDEAKKYNKVKLQPTIDETKVLKGKVRDENSRDNGKSTALMKRFRGGWIMLTGANSSKGLQMISVKVVIREEISEYPDDVDGRGDPAEMAAARLTAYRDQGDYKLLDVSTPKNEGSCRITEFEEAGDRRRRYVPCPACGWYQILLWKTFVMKDADGRRVTPHFRCGHCDAEIGHHHKRRINAAGKWVPTFVEEEAAAAALNPAPPELIAPEEIERWRNRPTSGRDPSYAWWAVYNPFDTWQGIADDYEAAQGNPTKLKAFTQQKLAEAWREQVDVPDADRLAERTVDLALDRLPAEACFFVGFCDVQGNRLEWSVYAVGPYMTMWEIDFGVIPGDPSQRDVWDKLYAVTQRKYPNAHGRLWGIEAFGVDSGYLSNQVYLFSRRAPNLYATDGQGKPLLPALGSAKPVDVDLNGRKVKGGAEIWPIGTHSMKVETMAALTLTLQGQDEHGAFPPGALIYSKKRTADHFEQLTAEHLIDTDSGKRKWARRKPGAPNEALDIAVGCRALAYHVGAGWMDDAAWQQLLADRQAPPPEGERDLFSAAFAAPPVGEAPPPPEPSRAAPVEEAPPAPPPPANVVRSISSLLA